MVQQFGDFCQLLDQLHQEWRTETLIHLDIKADNYLVVNQGGKNRKRGLKMVDWEMTSAGDPCWDVGSVFSDYLGFWLLSAPITGDSPPERFMELARYPLQRMQPAIVSFWRSYAAEMAFDKQMAMERLLRSVR